MAGLLFSCVRNLPIAAALHRQFWVESYRLRGTATGRFLPVATGSFGSKAVCRDRLLSTQSCRWLRAANGQKPPFDRA